MWLIIFKVLAGIIFIILPGYALRENLKSHPILSSLSLVFGFFLVYLSINPLLNEESKHPADIRTESERNWSQSEGKEKKTKQKTSLRIVYPGIWVAHDIFDSNSVYLLVNGKKVIDKASLSKGFDITIDTEPKPHTIKIGLGFAKTMIPPKVYSFVIPQSGNYGVHIKYNQLALSKDDNWEFTFTELASNSS